MQFEFKIQENPRNFPEEMKRLLESYSELLRLHDVHVAAHTPDALQRFSAYPEAAQAEIYQGFVKSLSSIIDVIEGGIPLENVPQSLWCIFKKHGLRPKSNLFSSIDENDTVMIYLPNHMQWYRSFNYFRYSSYSLGEPICIPWFELYEHQDSHMGYLMQLSSDMFANQVQATVFPELGPTLSRELFSSKRLVASIVPKLLSPVVDESGVNQAVVLVWKINVLGSDIGTDRDRQVKPLTSPQLVEATPYAKPETN